MRQPRLMLNLPSRKWLILPLAGLLTCGSAYAQTAGDSLETAPEARLQEHHQSEFYLAVADASEKAEGLMNRLAATVYLEPAAAEPIGWILSDVARLGALLEAALAFMLASDLAESERDRDLFLLLTQRDVGNAYSWADRVARNSQERLESLPEGRTRSHLQTAISIAEFIRNKLDGVR